MDLLLTQPLVYILITAILEQMSPNICALSLGALATVAAPVASGMKSCSIWHSCLNLPLTSRHSGAAEGLSGVMRGSGAGSVLLSLPALLWELLTGKPFGTSAAISLFP